MTDPSPEGGRIFRGVDWLSAIGALYRPAARPRYASRSAKGLGSGVMGNMMNGGRGMGMMP